MLNELLDTIHHSSSLFEDTVRDSFGQSILNDIFVPVINEINSLQRLNEHLEHKENELKHQLEQIRSIKTGSSSLI